MSEFKEYEEWEASLDQKYLKQLSPDAFELSPAAFYAGQQSQQAKIDLLEVQLKGAEERAKLTLDHKNRMVDELQKENNRLNTWYKNVKLQLENKQIDCDRSDKERDELQARIKQGLKIAEDLMGEMQNYKLGESLENILKGNKDEN